MEEVACILCSKPGLPWLEKADKFPPHERFRVMRCPECGLAWVSPRPGPQDIGRYYPDTYSWKPEAVGEQSLVHRAEQGYRFHLLRFETRQLLANTDPAPGDARRAAHGRCGRSARQGDRLPHRRAGSGRGCKRTLGRRAEGVSKARRPDGS